MCSTASSARSKGAPDDWNGPASALGVGARCAGHRRHRLRRHGRAGWIVGGFGWQRRGGLRIGGSARIGRRQRHGHGMVPGQRWHLALDDRRGHAQQPGPRQPPSRLHREDRDRRPARAGAVRQRRPEADARRDDQAGRLRHRVAALRIPRGLRGEGMDRADRRSAQGYELIRPRLRPVRDRPGPVEGVVGVARQDVRHALEQRRDDDVLQEGPVRERG